MLSVRSVLPVFVWKARVHGSITVLSTTRASKAGKEILQRILGVLKLPRS